MKRYDDIVVGGGISGMTLALLMALNGRSVLLLEKSSRIGGSIARFYKEGIPFDTGFHFTGGFHENGVLYDMLGVLGIQDMVQPVYLTKAEDNRFVLEEGQGVYDLPSGYQATICRMKEYFPRDTRAIERYFGMVKGVCTGTGGMNLRDIAVSAWSGLEEDRVSLGEVLSGLTDNRELKGLLAGLSMCYGVRPGEMSFANHSRVTYGLYESVARVENGGDAFISAFEKRFGELDVEVRPNSWIRECGGVHESRVGWFALNSGEEVSCEHCIFTIHPQEILRILPRQHLSKAFVNRVSDFEPSIGLFCVYSVVEGNGVRSDGAQAFGPSVLSVFPTADIDALFDARYKGDRALVIMRNLEKAGGIVHQVVNACEVSCVEEWEAWKDSTLDSRPAGYEEYKERRVARVRERIVAAYPEYAGSLRVVDAASPLTFKAYLNSPDGSAYGIKQKMAQFNLFGKLPLRNLYAAGQSSLLPGLVGAMMSSFIVGRSIVGKEEYGGFLKRRLGC